MSNQNPAPDARPTPPPALPVGPQTKSVGTVLEVADGAKVERPTGPSITVTGTAYVLDVPGVHVIDGRQIVAE